MSDAIRRILWIHGWGMSAKLWEPSVTQQCTGLGMEPHFFSYAEGHSIEAFQEALDRVLRDVKPEVIVGWSMGGILAVDRLSKLPGQSKDGPGTALGALGIKRLIVVGSTLRFVSGDRKMGWPRRIVERMLDKLETDRNLVLSQFADAMISAQERAEGKGMTAGEPDFSLEGLKAGLRYLIESDVTEAWSNLLVPEFTSAGGRILWIHGSEDGICPVEAMPEEMEGVRRVVLKGAGHAPFMTQQTAFYEQLRGFLDDDKD